jgi:hypothetical protein
MESKEITPFKKIITLLVQKGAILVPLFPFDVHIVLAASTFLPSSQRIHHERILEDQLLFQKEFFIYIIFQGFSFFYDS